MIWPFHGIKSGTSRPRIRAPVSFGVDFRAKEAWKMSSSSASISRQDDANSLGSESVMRIVKLPFVFFESLVNCQFCRKRCARSPTTRAGVWPIELIVHFAAGFGRCFLLPFQERRRDKRRGCCAFHSRPSRRAQVSMKDLANSHCFLDAFGFAFCPRLGAVSLSLTTSISIVPLPRAILSLTLAAAVMPLFERAVEHGKETAARSADSLGAQEMIKCSRARVMAT